jgi:transcriptional regulator with XRE-family HTH domain
MKGRHRNPPKTPLDHEPTAVTYARQQAGLTKTALAQRCGVSVSLISEIESGTRNATPAMIAKLAAILNCPRVILERKRGDAPPAPYRHRSVHRRDPSAAGRG